MTYADQIFKENISNILENGVFSENARPKYKMAKQPTVNILQDLSSLMILKRPISYHNSSSYSYQDGNQRTHVDLPRSDQRT